MTDRIGQQLGNYRLTQLLGQGGFAEVYLGEHLHLNTLAAVKVLHTQLAGEDVTGFRAEARTVAHLEHPHIVRVLDFGIEGTLPFLVMSYAPNGSLRQRHRRGTALPLPTIRTYLQQVAEALQYAHDEKLIHRDIKPENMLVGRRDEILLSDFGIAIVAQTSRAKSVQEVVGTVAYMAPEMLQGHPRAASDQYALGIVLYEWLCGERPFQGGFTELASQHMFVPPPPLREKLPGLFPEIEQVVMTALAKDPQQRFSSLRAFAQAFDQACLGTHAATEISLRSLPASSQKPAWPERPTTPAPAMPINTPPQLPPTVVASNTYPAVNTPPQLPPTIVDPAVNTPQWSPQPPTPQNAPMMLPTMVAPTLLPPPPVRPIIEETTRSTQALSRRKVLVGLTGLAAAGGGLTWWMVARNSQGALYTYHGHTKGVNAIAWSPDGSHIASGSDDNTVQVWGATDGSQPFTYHGHTAAVTAVTWLPSGDFITSESEDMAVKLWNATDGSHSLSGNFDNTVNLWNAASGSLPLADRGPIGSVFSLVRLPSGDGRIASVRGDNTVQVWDTGDGSQLLTYRGHSGPVNSIAWSPDNKYIASGGYDKTVQVWNATDGSHSFTYQGHASAVYTVAWSPDGKRIASGSDDKTVQIWDATDGGQPFTYRGHAVAVLSLAWSPDGKRIVSGSGEGTVQVWNATDGSQSFTYRGHTRSVVSVVWSPDGSRIASGSYDNTVQVWNA